MRAAGRARTGLRAHYPDPHCVFSSDLRAGAGPAGQTLIAIPNFYCPMVLFPIVEANINNLNIQVKTKDEKLNM